MMRCLLLSFCSFVNSVLNAQDTHAFIPRQTLELCADSCESQKLGIFEISVKIQHRSRWAEDHRIVFSKYAEKIDTLWPHKTKLLPYRNIWYVVNMWLFEQDKLIIIIKDTGGGVIYLLYKWDGNSWNLIDTHLVGHVFRGYNSPDILVQAVDYNKLVITQGTKKQLIEYDLVTKTEKRTEIKE